MEASQQNGRDGSQSLNIQTSQNSAFITPSKGHLSIDTTTASRENGSTTRRRASPRASPTGTVTTTPTNGTLPLSISPPTSSISPRNNKFSPILKRKKRRKNHSKLEYAVVSFLMLCILSMLGMFLIGSKLILYTNKIKDEAQLDQKERETGFRETKYNEIIKAMQYKDVIAPKQVYIPEQNDEEFEDRIYPRILHFSSSPLKLQHSQRSFTPDPMLYVTPGEESPPNDLRRKPYEDGNCVPMADWQVQSFPNCNVVHEMNFGGSGGLDSFMEDGEVRKEGGLKRRSITSIEEAMRSNAKMKDDAVKYLGRGWFRQAWRVDHGGGDGTESTVIKVLRVDRDFYDEFYELHRRDAVAMERLTFSPYIIDIYGYCGQTAINELANSGHGLVTLENLKLKLRDNNKKAVTHTKLQIGAMIAVGVSHIHELGYDSGYSFMTHYDINPRNIAIMEGGRPKINDFNVAEFLRWDVEKNESCGFHGRFHDPWWRAPEEMILNSSSVYVNGTKTTTYTTGISDNAPMLSEKVDVYALGNVLYDLLTGHSPRGKMYEQFKADAREKVLNGEPPVLPRYHEKSSDPSIVAMRRAMRKCWEKDPQRRASAKEVANDLVKAAMEMQKEKGVEGK